ncbi:MULTISPECIES: DUF1236 domain-containing protein [Rhodopseudomonas]|uniref:Membrane protein n=1 Tax=Rhodopseudomonas palustris TaxID=1076 RepID=A0A0D7F2G9_RHOPL|nr:MULTISPECIES: DUF1236 domain-containing protein [Rhodopseudomonas]KIZ47283.1 membrane protein [Rhodopseudomonas palustris]MDF3811586.1 DUF1236 domain-containing protein [Rhodopseudomonas sp. BAL398]WOK19909.1 DUF1236 domain-containing protein [Rhodopseudomonas sp. BAL398]
MTNRFAVSILALSLLAPGVALAQSTTATGAANGARSGGAVAGPIGEAVGGTVGAAVGAAVEIPNAVINSVRGVDTPSVRMEQEVALGERLPPSIKLYPIKNNKNYRYAVVNDQRVIVNPKNRKVVRIVD